MANFKSYHNENHYKKVRQYIDYFYVIINSEKLIEREFINKARTADSDYWSK